jgi:hypothetical protein
MLVRKIRGCTATIGADQGYFGLPIRNEMRETIIGGNIHSLMHTDTAWEPTPAELKRLNDGHSLIISLMLFGNPYPPITVGVDDGEDEPAMSTRSKRIGQIIESLEEAIISYKRLLEFGELSAVESTEVVSQYQALILILGMFQGWPK